MKRVFKLVSEISILIAGTSIISSYFVDLGVFNNSDFINGFVVIYLIASLYYHRMDIKDKNKQIKKLKNKLDKRS